MLYNGNGQPDPNGEFQIIDGMLKPRALQPGESVTFDVSLMDAAGGSQTFRDGKAVEPASIDEALKQTLQSMAKARHVTVQQLLANMKHAEIEKLASEVAAQFVSGKAAEGIAKEFGDELGYRVAAAKAKHNLGEAHRPAEQRRPFVADAALADAIRTKVGERAQQMALAADPLNDASYQHGMEVAQRHLRKQALSAGRGQ